MMLFANAFQTLGQIHTLLGDDPGKAARYRKVVENIVDPFVKAAVSHAAADGTLDPRSRLSSSKSLHMQTNMAG